MTARGILRIECASADEAGRLLGALAADDDPHCKSRREGAAVVAEVEGQSARGLLRAADDLLACLSVAEDVMKKP